MTAPVDFQKTLAEVRTREARWHANPGAVWGEPTGLATLDRLTGGLHPGSLVVVGGRTSHGKSALVMQIAVYVASTILSEWAEGSAEPPGQVIVISPEMTAADLMERFATQTSKVPIEKVRTGDATEEERATWLEAAEEMALFSQVMQLYAGDDITFHDIIDVVQESTLAGPPVRLVVIDYLQRIQWGQVGGGNEYQQLTSMANQLKSLANTHRIPIIVASQLNRAIEKDLQSGKTVERPPELSDLHGSGAIEAACDVGILVWRPPEAQKVHKGVDTAQKAMIYVKKNRHGAVNEEEMLFFPSRISFEDRRK